MSRLIDAENLDVVSFVNQSIEFADGAQAVLEMIDNQPTVDAIPTQAVRDAIAEIQELDESIPYLGCFKEGWHNSGQKTGLEQALDIIRKHTGIGGKDGEDI